MKRFLEIDLARTIAILLMVIYHVLFDLSAFYGYGFRMRSGGLLVMGRTAAILFLITAGVSTLLSQRDLLMMRPLPWDAIWRKATRRAIRIGGAAILVTLVTLAIAPDQYVRFGILHCMAVGALLLPFFLRWKEWMIPLGAAIVAFGLIWTPPEATSPYWLPFGLKPDGFASLDYFPLIPWFGFLLIGAGLGWALWIRRKRGIPYSTSFSESPLSLLLWPGRHALLVYLIHQPIIMGVLLLTLGWPTTSL